MLITSGGTGGKVLPPQPFSSAGAERLVEILLINFYPVSKSVSPLAGLNIM